ncbi:MAG: zinc-dependent peptidase [Opitutales bacterium]
MLSVEEKRRFEHKVQEFLLNFRITGAETSLDDADRLLAASGVVIFRLNDWRYGNLDEVAVCGDSFNRNFEGEGEDQAGEDLEKAQWASGAASA